MKRADMTFPIIIWKEKELVIDGNHRLGRAFIDGLECMGAIVFDDEIMNKMCLGTFSNSVEYLKVINEYGDNWDEIFRERFVSK